MALQKPNLAIRHLAIHTVCESKLTTPLIRGVSVFGTLATKTNPLVINNMYNFNLSIASLKFVFFVALLLPMKGYAGSIHPDLELQLLKHGETEFSGVIKFEQYQSEFEVIFEMAQIETSVVLDSKDITHEVRSVFLYDINGDQISEIFIIYNQNGRNSLEGYSVREIDYDYDYDIRFFKTLNKITAKAINKKIAGIENFNAELAKKELSKLFPYYKVVNFDTYDKWNVEQRVGRDNYYSKAYYYRYELLEEDYQMFDLQKYFKTYSLDNLKFIKKTDGNGLLMSNGDYYFMFVIHDLGLVTLVAVFQGEITADGIIKNGKYFNSTENGDYREDIKVGVWQSYTYAGDLERYIPLKLHYDQGRLTQSDMLYRYMQEIYIYRSEFYDQQADVQKVQYYELSGEISQIRYYKNSSLQKAINYTHFKREYANYEIKTNAQTGYKYYEQRESRTQFKALNLIDAKLENERLGLYSITDSTGNEIFIQFERYTPVQTLDYGIRWEDEQYFGVTEIYYGKRKKDSIEEQGDIVRDGYYEAFKPGFYPGADYITNLSRNIETVVECGYFEQGKKSGQWRSYNRYNGDVLSLITCQDGICHGPYERYDGDGEVEEKGRYVDGAKTVDWVAPYVFRFSS